MITSRQVLLTAADLVSDGSNPQRDYEGDLAITKMACQLVGYGADVPDVMLTVLRMLK